MMWYDDDEVEEEDEDGGGCYDDYDGGIDVNTTQIKLKIYVQW